MIDFEVPPELEAVRGRVARFVRDEVLPAEAALGDGELEPALPELRRKARAAGLWAPHLPPSGEGWAWARWAWPWSPRSSASPPWPRWP